MMQETSPERDTTISDPEPPETGGLSPDLRRFLESAVDSGKESARIVLATIPAPAGDPEGLFEAVPGEPAFFWDSPGDGVFVALGAAETAAARGEERFGEIRACTERIGRTVRPLAAPGCPEPGVRWFGGFAFRPGDAAEAPWTPFGDGRFMLPRWTWSFRGRDAFLTIALPVGADPAAWADLMGRTDRILAAVGRAPTGSFAPPRTVRIRRTPPGTWRKRVETIRTGIRAGRYRKIVLARRCVVETADPYRPADLLRRLGAFYPGCYRFAVRREGTVFLGASPERLVRREGSAVQTEALAGSIALAEDASTAEYDARVASLISDAKEISEHGLVVEEIRRRLGPLCGSLEVPDRPRVLRLRRVMHLQTPFLGRLRGPLHVLELARTLHPTPAVGGVPTEAAVEWIAEHEGVPRGWYAGPVGWFDGRGEGELAVALRCGLLEGPTAYLYAGAGIVAGSDPAREYEETALKQRALLAVMGIEE